MAKKPAVVGSARAITDSLRLQVREELPEVAQISDQDLQNKSVEAWAFALAHSSYKSIRDVPPAGNPDTKRRPSEATRRTTCAVLRDSRSASPGRWGPPIPSLKSTWM